MLRPTTDIEPARRTLRPRTARVQAESAETLARIRAALDPWNIEVAAESEADVFVLAFDEFDPPRRQRLRGLARESLEGPLIAVVPDGPDGERSVPLALRSGLAGIVLLSEVEAALGPTVIAAAAGQIVIPARARDVVRGSALTQRERETLRLAVAGLCNDEIAARMYLATSTVKTHLRSAFVKLGVSTRAEAVALLTNGNELTQEPLPALVDSLR